ncbi:hypothetical protein V8E52_009184 [Russula decolorans]
MGGYRGHNTRVPPQFRNFANVKSQQTGVFETGPYETGATESVSIFDASLQSYNNKTKNRLLDHPLASRLQSCDSPNAILSVLQDLIQQFDQRRTSDKRLNNWLNPTMNVLYTFSAILSDGVSLTFPPIKVIFAGIGVLLLVSALVDILI